MDFPELPHWLHWFDATVQLLQRFFIVVVGAFIAIRFGWLRQALRGAELKWRYRIPAILVFGMLAVIGTHSGIVIDLQEGWRSIEFSVRWPIKLRDSQAIVGFRDTITLASGMIGGPWVGIGTGLLAGADRYHLGGLAGLASGLTTLLLGIYAGGIRYFKPRWVATVKGVFWVALIGTLLHRGMILILVHPYSHAVEITKEVAMPVMVINTLGCVLFFWIMLDLDRDRLEKEAQEARLLMLQAELRALRAQVDPHFLNNTLGDLGQLIEKNSGKAKHYADQLADFFSYTRKFAANDTIYLDDECAQLQRYLELQRLGLEDKLQASVSVPSELLRHKVIPGCLLTLAENALKHGFDGRPSPYQLAVSAETEGEYLVLKVIDNGRGMSRERLQELGKWPVLSESKSGGVALHQLLQCLRLTFGENVDLSFESIVDKGTVAILRQPLRSEPC